MRDTDDQRAAARKEAALMATELRRVTGLLEEVATVWRRAGRYGQQPSSCTPGSLQDAARNLAAAVSTLPDADAEQYPALAFSAAAQLAGLAANAVLSAALTCSGQLGDAGIWVAIRDALQQAVERLWRLISHLVKIGERSPVEDREAPLRALATQRTAIDALPEIDLRRLLDLIGGLDPAALQRAAAAYTETFCTVSEMEGSVAALRPVAMLPCDGLPGPRQGGPPGEAPGGLS